MFNKRIYVLILTLIFCIPFGVLMLSLNTPEILQTSRNNNIKDNDEKPKISANNDTIFIDGNNMFADNASSEGWNGNGTYSNPYIIENYKINASIRYGIEIRNTDVYFIIRNVTVSDGRSNYNHGFYFTNVTNGELINNIADNNIAGFLLRDSNNNTLTGNTATNSLHGFRIWYSNNNTLTNNTANSNIEYGIFLDNSNNNTISENILLLNGLGGIYEENCEWNDISDNNCGLQPFILFSDVDGFDPDGTFTLNWTVSENADKYTLYQNSEIIAEGLTITNYTITDLAIGTYVFFVKAINEYEELDSNTIEIIVSHIIHIDGNVDFYQTAVARNFTGNGTYGNPYLIENYEIIASVGHGIHIQNTDVYFIIRNVIVSNGRSNYNYGFYFTNVTNGKLENNTANNNLNGFTLSSSNNNTITNNTANNNDQHGFHLWYSNNNILTNNTANDNIEYGIFLDNSNNNTISENILLLNGLGGIYEKNCVWNDISDNKCGLLPVTLYSDVDDLDEDGSFTLTWTASENADKYTLYQNDEIIAEELTILEYNITDLPVGTYVFYVKAINEYEEKGSNTIEVIVSQNIHVDGNADFNQTAVALNLTGNGTYGNPYIIENYEIIAFKGHGIHIQNTDVYFIIRNVTVSDGRSNNYFGFYLENATNGKLKNNTANNNLYGFFLKDSYNNTITNNTANNNLKYGIYLEESNFNEISE
ncbi:MAG: right-handed parallel beta-helix repeat-containing protein, partial [Candidatus Lokiarchaeia archaeon]